MIRRLLIFAAGLAAGLQAASQVTAWRLGDAAALGPRLMIGGRPIYPPWAILVWRRQLSDAAAQLFSPGALLILLGALAGLAAARVAFGRGPPPRVRGWGGLKEARRAGLLQGGGCVLGELDGRLLTTADLRPTLVTGGTRSGKGRGHVVPSLLAWTGSVLVHDPKGELWQVTAGWRSRFSHTLAFAPRDPGSARWNPLAEIRPGPGEIAQVQRLVAILADPGGRRDEEAIWDTAAADILEALVLHVLYTADDADKTLLQVRALLADLDQTAETLLKTRHRRGADCGPETHPFIATAATGFLSMHDRFRTSVQGTARAYLKWLAGEDLERSLSASDFALGDLMCADAPVSLYVQVAPADAAALRPLVRLLFYAAAQALTTEAARDAAGRRKRHPLLMVMDEFPLLGRLEFFEKSLRLMSGYGIKPLLVAQSLNDIAETYGVQNTLLDNCYVYTAFSALDPLTQEKVSRLTGSVTELRTGRSGPAGLAAGRSTVSRSEVERPLLEPGEIRALRDDLQLVFVAGQRPLLAVKLRYDRREPFRTRAAEPPPGLATDRAPRGASAHPWAGRGAVTEDAPAAATVFDQALAAMTPSAGASRARPWDAADANPKERP